MSDQKTELPKGFDCSCGKHHEYPAYVYAHWDIKLTHTCDCGAEHILLRGIARRVKP